MNTNFLFSIRISFFFAFIFLFFSSFSFAQTPPVNVTLWFDTEDYILPQSDDAAKRLAEMLTRLGIKATFKVVGEKARVLEQRGRKDVIEALKKHEIGYHSNLHSQHPTPAEYLQNTDWDEGVAEFYARESQGVKDIQRIFGQDAKLLWSTRQFVGSAGVSGAEKNGHQCLSRRSQSRRH